MLHIWKKKENERTLWPIRDNNSTLHKSLSRDVLCISDQAVVIVTMMYLLNRLF